MRNDINANFKSSNLYDDPELDAAQEAFYFARYTLEHQHERQEHLDMLNRRVQIISLGAFALGALTSAVLTAMICLWSKDIH